MTTLAPTIELVSNGYTLSSAPDRLGYLVPSDPERPRDELWEQYQAQGYLWLKGLLDRTEVLAFRRRFFSAFVDARLPLIAPGTDPVEGIFDVDAPATATDPALYHRISLEVVRWAEYEAFCLMTPIRRFYETFLEGAPYLHKRKLIRYAKPRTRTVQARTTISSIYVAAQTGFAQVGFRLATSPWRVAD